jgi:hypothetical protein
MSEQKDPYSPHTIPEVLRPHFQEYEFEKVDLQEHANLVIQRTLEFGDWPEVRWLFLVYGKQRICEYVRQYGERGLSPVTFNYWRMMFGLRKWKKGPISPEVRKEVWNP